MAFTLERLGTALVTTRDRFLTAVVNVLVSSQLESVVELPETRGTHGWVDELLELLKVVLGFRIPVCEVGFEL